nr:methyltransferase [Oceanusvirus sp.]
MTEHHLGGHSGVCNLDEGLLRWCLAKGGRSFLDVGCGTGEMVAAAEKEGFERVAGIEGDTEVAKCHGAISAADFSVDAELPADIRFPDGWDVVYSCEFLEHITEPDFLERASAAFRLANKMIVITAAPPGWGGHHHVNENTHEYWVRMFNKIGYEHDPELTREARAASTMNSHRHARKRFFRHRGLVFVPANPETPISEQYRETRDKGGDAFVKRANRTFESAVPAVRRMV